MSAEEFIHCTHVFSHKVIFDAISPSLLLCCGTFGFAQTVGARAYVNLTTVRSLVSQFQVTVLHSGISLRPAEILCIV